MWSRLVRAKSLFSFFLRLMGRFELSLFLFRSRFTGDISMMDLMVTLLFHFTLHLTSIMKRILALFYGIVLVYLSKLVCLFYF